MQGSTVEASPAAAGRRRIVGLALKLLVGLVIIAAPVLIASNWVPGISEVAFYGVLAASFGWISGGPRGGAAIVASLAVLGVVSVLLHGQTWALALILLLLGLAYGFAASRGVGKIVLQLPILTPYFMLKPPALFNNPAVIDATYIIGVIVVMIAVGFWTILVLHLAVGKRALKPLEVHNLRIPLIYGAILGLFSAAVMIIGTTTDVKTHWVWITLTLYVLADPQQLYSRAKTWGRVLGTLAGFVVVSLISLLGVPDGVLIYLAIPALWLCLLFMLLKKPYWQYAFFLTVTVVLMDTSDVSTLLLDAERFGFTIVGAGLSVVAALLVNFLGYGRAGLRSSERQ
ncbi:FUSC family protein [Microbacterium sp. A94]|uniref:FUSC family protein n=1 Tax=Microbacterium sp. A94 TaxID=3450717 RepID=UPI003F42C385